MSGRGIITEVVKAIRDLRDSGKLAGITSFSIDVTRVGGRWDVQIGHKFDSKLWLTPECKARGCKVASQFLLSHIADGVVHRYLDPDDPMVMLYRAVVIEDATSVQENPQRLEKCRTDLARLAHDEPHAHRRQGGTLLKFDYLFDELRDLPEWEKVERA
jgi:hypothetical protein